MKIRSIYYLSLFSFLQITLFAQLPSGRIINWANRGVMGGIPSFTNTVNFLSRGGIINNTIADNSDSLQALINAKAGSKTIIYFPAGTYSFKKKISFPAGGKLVLRGAGADSTFFQFNAGDLNGGGNIEIWGSQTAGPFNVTAGCSKDSTKITLTGTTGLAVGDWIDISQENDTVAMYSTNPPNSVGLAPRTVGQIMKIAAITGNIITLDRPLHYTYKLNLTVQINKLAMTRLVGFENFTIENLYNGNNANFVLNTVANGWFKCIRSIKPLTCHINPTMCANLTIRDSYFHDSFDFGNGGHGYGVALSTHTTDCLIENNVFDKLRHAMLVQRGANGNVFGYNYSINATTSGTVSSYHRPPDISIHGYFPHMNLYEGNIVQSIYSADYWGPSGNGNTFFRNRATHGWIKMDDHSIEQNVLGNEVNGPSSIFYTESQIVNDPSCINTILDGNNDHGTTTWDTNLGSNNLINSYYLTSAPTFFQGAQWPSIGPEFTLGSGSIPAEARYQQGYDTECEINFTTGIIQNVNSQIISVYPNPANADFIISANKNWKEISIYNNLGKLIQTINSDGANKLELNIKNWNEGLYFIFIRYSDNTSASSKIIKAN